MKKLPDEVLKAIGIAVEKTKGKAHDHTFTPQFDKELNRTEIVFALAKHAHPDWYHSLLNWKTEDLKKLLEWYQGKREVEKEETIHIGIDWAISNPEEIVIKIIKN